MFELLRKFFLFMLLFVVGMGTYLSAMNATDWNEPLWVTVYPINGDGLDTTERYIDSLKQSDFADIERFIEREAQHYRVEIEKPVKMTLGPGLNEAPPPPPVDANFLRIGLWSLKLRWWTERATSDHAGPEPDIKLFLVYHDPDVQPTLSHSVGLQKGRVGIVNVFSSRAQATVNNFVIAHEMLHTLGATDKYEPPDLLPVFPDGYADPQKMPLYPQTRAEIMGGRIAISATRAVMPDDLSEVDIGPQTAEEIRWLR